MSSIRARVTAIFWTPNAGEAMRSADRVTVITGVGIQGDRYARGVGAYSGTRAEEIRHITFITQDGIDTARQWQEAAGLPAFDAAATRRNIVLSDMSAEALNQTVGQRFRVGDVECLGVELATPCGRPSQLTQQSGFQEAFEGRGGLRAEVLCGGTVKISDTLSAYSGRS